MNVAETNATTPTAQTFSSQEPWVLFKLNTQTYGIPAHNTQEMISIPEVTPIPRAPQAVRGVINLRGSVIALIDLRIKLKQPSRVQELEALITHLQKREQENVDWVDALEKHVKENVPFTLARDPHQCAFGKWYDTYKPDSPQLAGILLRFDFPHKAIHSAADQIEAFMAKGETNKAEELLAMLHDNYLPKMKELFSELRDALIIASRQEIAIVVEQEGTVIAITVDAVDAVEPLQANSVEELPGQGTDDNYIVHMMGRRTSNSEPVLIPDLSKIIKETSFALNQENQA